MGKREKFNSGKSLLNEVYLLDEEITGRLSGEERRNGATVQPEHIPCPKPEKKNRESKYFELLCESGRRRKRKRENLEDIDLRCKVCEKTLADVPSLVRHLRESTTHRDKLLGSTGKYSCGSCEKHFYGKDAMIDHLTSMSHEVVVAQNVFDYRFHRKITETLDCSYCDFDADEIDEAIFHFLSDPHEKRLKTPDVAVDGTLVFGPSADDFGSRSKSARTRIPFGPVTLIPSVFYCSFPC